MSYMTDTERLPKPIDRPAKTDAQLIVIQAVMLPFIVLAMIVPLTAGFIFGGPILGVALGFLAAGGVIAYGVKNDPDPLEVAENIPNHSLLAICTAEITPQAVDDLDQLCPLQGEAVTVIAPLRMSKLDHWAGDLQAAESEAGYRAVRAAQLIKEAGVATVFTDVGDADLWLAVADALRQYPSEHICLMHQIGEETATINEISNRSPIDFIDLAVR